MCIKWVALAAVAMIGLAACSLPCHAQAEPLVPAGQLRGPDQLPPLRLAYDQFPDNVRERMRIVVEQPTLARGGAFPSLRLSQTFFLGQTRIMGM